MTARWWYGTRQTRYVIADLGPYTGPWPPLAPNWVTLEAFTKDPANWDIAGDVSIAYVTSLPSADPRLVYEDFWLVDDTNIATHAEMGTYVRYDYGRTNRYLAPVPWDGPNYWWDSNEVTPFSLDGPPRRAGLHLYVMILWGYGYYQPTEDRVGRIVRTLDPALLAPIGWAANTRGPVAGPDAVWSIWEPYSNHTTLLNDFEDAPGVIFPGGQFEAYTAWFGATGTDFDTAFADAAAQLRATVPAGTTQDNPQFGPDSVPQYQGIRLNAFGDGTVSVGLQAWQYAQAYDVDQLWPDSRIDRFSVRPDNYSEVLGDLIRPPTNYGWFDPYTYDGRGWQWEDPNELRYLELANSTGVTSAGFLNTYDALNAPRPPGLPYRIYVREFTGPETEWLPLDGDAINLGDYAGPVDPGPSTWFGNSFNVWYQGFATVNIPFHKVPWRKFWVIQVPSYVFGGPAPSYNDWPGRPIAGTNRNWAYIFDQGIWGAYFAFTQFHFSEFELGARYRFPRWRYYKPFSLLDTLPRATAKAGDRDVMFRTPPQARPR